MKPEMTELDACAICRPMVAALPDWYGAAGRSNMVQLQKVSGWYQV